LSFNGRRDFADWKNKLRLGGPVEKYPDGYGFNMFMPVEKYWLKHPEWYELKAGKRRRFFRQALFIKSRDAKRIRHECYPVV